MEKHSSENPLTTTSSHETKPWNRVRKFEESIPVDLLIEILSRVPGKSVARFRCVSKLWADILNRPYFTELFLAKSWTRSWVLFFFKSKEKLFIYSSPRPQNLDKNSSLVATPCPKDLAQDIPLGSCTLVNGLAFLWSYTLSQVICNPATGEFLTLPKLEVESRPDVCQEFHFGYDPIGKQFKVLCMTNSDEERLNTHLVLTLENNGKPNSWRSIQHRFYFKENDRTMEGDVCIDGVLYFAADFGGSTVIVSFDVRSEKFGFIDTVEELATRYGDYFCMSLVLFNYKGKLALHDSDEQSKAWYHPQKLAFWVLEDHKWSKHVYPFSAFREKLVERYKFVGMSDAGDLVWSPRNVLNPFYLIFYNLESRKFTRVQVHGFEEFKEDEYISLHTLLGYEENIIRNSTWSQLTHTRKSSTTFLA